MAIYLLTSGEYSDFNVNGAIEFDGDIGPLIDQWCETRNRAVTDGTFKAYVDDGGLRGWLIANGAREADYFEVYEGEKWTHGYTRRRVLVDVGSRGPNQSDSKDRHYGYEKGAAPHE